jgi:hypothetical protein
MKNLVIAALVGAMTLENVSATRLSQKTTPIEAAEAIAEKAGAKNEEKAVK